MVDTTSPRVVAMVGGGASATLAAVYLLRREEWTARVVLIDRDGRHARGQAYSTEDRRHLLNACAAKMSAWADDPEHLLRWLRGEGWPGSGGDFPPRSLYGRYLRSVLDEAAAARPGLLREVTAEVTGIRPYGTGGWRVDLADGGGLDADAVVLATGNTAPAAWPWAPDDARYVADPWALGALDAGDGPVLVAGTGLTMVDVALSVTGRCPDTVVYAVSRRGLLPEAHRCPAAPPAPFELPGGPVPLGVLVRAVRRAIDENDGEWQGVVDALRPHVPRLWGQLSLKDKQVFLRSLARRWEVCRHRLPPESAAAIDELRASGRLRVLRGSIASVAPYASHLAVGLDDGRELRVGRIVNGTGPGRPSSDPFLAGLLGAGVLREDPLGLGLEADESGAALDTSGRPHDRLFTLGPTLRGLHYETTSIPEIRAQAVRLAERLSPRLAA